MTKPIGALKVLAKSVAPGALGELAIRTRHGDSWDRRVEDGNRALVNVRPETRDRVEAEVGTRAFLEAAFELGGRTPNGTTWDEPTVVSMIKAHAKLGERRSDPEFKSKLLAGDQAALDELALLHEAAFPPLPGGARG